MKPTNIYIEHPIPTDLLPWIRRATLEDALSLKDSLAPDDVREIAIIHRQSPEIALRESFERSSWCGAYVLPEKPEEVQAIFGVTRPCIVWLLKRKGFPASYKVSQAFLRNSRKLLAWALEHTNPQGFLYNFTIRGCKKNRRWLAWLGALELEAVPYGESIEEDIIPFYFDKEVIRQCVAH